MLEDALTPQEKLLLHRRRKGHGLPAAAAYWNVSVRQYGAWEDGALGIPAVDLGGITMGEQLFVLRVRLGITRRDLAQRLGIRWKDVRDSEEGHRKVPHPALVDFFEGGP